MCFSDKRRKKNKYQGLEIRPHMSDLYVSDNNTSYTKFACNNTIQSTVQYI